MSIAPPPPPFFPSLVSDESPPDAAQTNIVTDWTITDVNTSCFSSLWISMGTHLTSEEPEKYTFTFIRGCQQIGPTCGLAALYMVAEHFSANVSSEQIFESAVSKKITTFGEIFSAKNLSQLAQEVLGSKADVVWKQGNLNKIVPEALFENHLILIPYDTDKNNEPCMLNGKKAHWAILCGVVTTKNNLFVIARQSKSRLLSMWNLEQLINSNANLKVADEKVRSGSIVPSEGLTQSLANQCIVIKKKNSQEIS